MCNRCASGEFVFERCFHLGVIQYVYMAKVDLRTVSEAHEVPQCTDFDGKSGTEVLPQNITPIMGFFEEALRSAFDPNRKEIYGFSVPITEDLVRYLAVKYTNEIADRGLNPDEKLMGLVNDFLKSK